MSNFLYIYPPFCNRVRGVGGGLIIGGGRVLKNNIKAEVGGCNKLECNICNIFLFLVVSKWTLRNRTKLQSGCNNLIAVTKYSKFRKKLCPQFFFYFGFSNFPLFYYTETSDTKTISEISQKVKM